MADHLLILIRKTEKKEIVEILRKLADEFENGSPPDNWLDDEVEVDSFKSNTMKDIMEEVAPCLKGRLQWH